MKDAAKREGNKKCLLYLEDEARYLRKFLAIYQHFTPLEKIAVGRSHEVKNLSMDMILLEVGRVRSSPQTHV